MLASLYPILTAFCAAGIFGLVVIAIVLSVR
jgi:hypothetical protein